MSRGYISVEDIARWRFGGILDKPGFSQECGFQSLHGSCYVEIFPWLGKHTLRTHSDPVMYVCNSSYVWIRFFLFLNDLHDEYINLYIYIYDLFLYIHTYVHCMYFKGLLHIYIYIYI